MPDIQTLTSQVQELAQKHSFWNTWSVYFIALTLIATGLYFFAQWMTNRRGNELSVAQAALINAKDEQARLHNMQVESDLKDKELKIGEANERASKADERAGKATKQAEEIAQENIKLRTDLENATAESRANQTELAREQQSLTKEQQKTAEAQEKAAKVILASQRYLSQVRSLQTPRRLVKGQNRDEFLQALKIHPPGTIDIIWAADFFVGEPKHFAEELAETLKEGGWTINKIEGVLLAADKESNKVSDQEAVGLKILVQNPEKPPLSAQALRWALLSSGFEVDFITNAQVKGNAVTLLVWTIPPEGGWVLRFPKP